MGNYSDYPGGPGMITGFSSVEEGAGESQSRVIPYEDPTHHC